MDKYQRVVVDIGTGDGGFVYKLALKHPKWSVIGIDPNHVALIETSRKIIKKKITNAMFVLASVFDLPEELNEISDHVYINFPWGSLLDGVNYIAKICKKGATVEILSEQKPKIVSEFKLIDLKQIDSEQLKKYPTTWAKRLAYGKPRQFYHIILKK